ncbi:MAG: hypothetical protein H0T42_11130 [Deltaproteobacteria bacterium]|nr:hypothetical protein [Deltaproteobacteria bacterium]
MREAIGEAIGRWLAPAVAAVSRTRNARMFHPEGHTFAARVVAAGEGAYAELGQRLTGRALVRFSPALWRNGIEIFDVLGFALRIRPGDGPPLDHVPSLGDQDLLFATIRSPLTMLLSPFTTDASDFAGNTYWAVSPFSIGELRRLELRLRPVDPKHGNGTRVDRLRDNVRTGHAIWQLEARRTLTLTWHPVAHVVIEREVAVDQAALRFDPFRSGAGIEPVGLVHAIRRAAYAASQEARPQRSAPRRAR